MTFVYDWFTRCIEGTIAQTWKPWYIRVCLERRGKALRFWAVQAELRRNGRDVAEFHGSRPVPWPHLGQVDFFLTR